MRRAVLLVLFLVAGKALFAQSVAHATVAATIVNPIGVEEAPIAGNDFVSISWEKIQKNGKQKNASPTEETVAMSQLRIVGSDQLFSVSLPAQTITVENATCQSGIQLSHLQLASAQTGKPDLFSLNARLNLDPALQAGLYQNYQPLDVTIHFN